MPHVEDKIFHTNSSGILYLYIYILYTINTINTHGVIVLIVKYILFQYLVKNICASKGDDIYNYTFSWIIIFIYIYIQNILINTHV